MYAYFLGFSLAYHIYAFWRGTHHWLLLQRLSFATIHRLSVLHFDLLIDGFIKKILTFDRFPANAILKLINEKLVNFGTFAPVGPSRAQKPFSVA
jgi:hypothetical protein